MKKIVALCLFICLFSGFCFSQTIDESQNSVSFGQDLIKGLESYKMGNWEDTLFFLKRTSEFQNASSDVVCFFVVMAEVNMRDFSSVHKDGLSFLEKFPNSAYFEEILYQTLYASFKLGMYEESINGFTKFMEEYPTNEKIDLAIFYTAESLYFMYEFENSRAMYNQLMINYPASAKYSDSKYRLELLEHREREDKLLYLLRVTGEEALSSKELYERQIKELQGEEAVMLRQRVLELENQNKDLLIKNEILQKDLRNFQNANSGINEDTTLIDELGYKAAELEKILERTNKD